MDRGLIHIYYGDGKGKTTAAFGLAFRSAGRGFKVVIAQFLKGRNSGELLAAEKFSNINIIRSKPTDKFTFQMNPEELQETAQNCTKIFKEAVEISDDAQLLIFDEVIDAINTGLLNMEILLNYLKNKPFQLEVVLTGHKLPEEFVQIADYITFMEKKKHPYDKGIAARIGVEL